MKRKRTGYIEAAMRNRNIVVIITIVLMTVGVVALTKMPRNEFPQFTIRQGVIVGVYPGASSEEVELQLTQKIENYIFGFKEVKKAKTYSQSKEGMMYLFVELNDDVKNADQFWSKLKHGLDELKPTLPTGVLALVANSDFGDTSALLITLSSDKLGYKELELELKKLEAECRKIPAVSKIKHFGLQKEKIYVAVKPELLNEYNIKTLSLLGSYQTNGMVNYAGDLSDKKNNMAVHLPANFESEKDLAQQIVYADPNGNVVRLKDIATIERRYEDPENYIRQNQEPAILLSLEMQPGNNIVQFGRDVDVALENFKKQTSGDIDVSRISELPKYVDHSVSNFMKEFLIAIIAVILVTMVLLPFRVSSVAGVTVPISVLITLGIMFFFGVELNTVSLAALIIVLGMIVDNSIVIIDNYVEKLDHGISPWHAAVKSAKELVTPIVTATLAICAAYIPLSIFLTGTAGEFVQPLPTVVCIALGVSVLVAILLVPYLNFVFIKKGLVKDENNKKKGKSFLEKLQSAFDTTLEKAFRHPGISIAAGLLLIGASVFLFKSIDQRLFPEMERNQFAVEVYLPNGASLESTATVIDSLEALLIKDKRVTNVTSFVGTSSPRFHTVYAPNMPASNYGQLLINTTSEEATREVVNEYSPVYSEHFANAHIKWKILALANYKYPIEIRITSDSIKNIRATEKEVNEILLQTAHLDWIKTDWEEKQQNIRINIDKDKASRLGYSKALVATSVMVGLEGIPLTTIWEEDYPVEVWLVQGNSGKKSIQDLKNQYITSPYTFTAVPLRSIATFTPEWTEGAIVHRNGSRTLTIQVDNDPKYMTSAIFDKLKPKIDALKLPEGTAVSYGGEYEGQEEVFIPMSIALGVSVILIFFILLFDFKKQKLSLLVMSTMLFAFPGAAIGLKVIGYPFSLTAFIGITSLVGMAVRNGIILIDYARELREKDNKMSVKEAALAAGKRRMRPIFLTSAAASVGVIPMILSGSPLWGPLGTVICFGLIVAMILTLYLLPILYSWMFSGKEKNYGMWSVPAKGRKTKKALATLLILPLFLPFQVKAQNLSLDSCKTLALQHNRKIKEAQLKVDEAEQVKKNVYTNYFPKINAQVFSMKANDYLLDIKTPEMNLPVYDGNPANLAAPTQFAYVPSIEIQALDYMNVGLVTAVEPIYAGGKIRAGYKLASLGKEVNEKVLVLSTSEVMVKTEEYYWTLVSLQAKRNTLESYEKLLNSLKQDVQISYDAGLIEKSDLLKVEMKLTEVAASKLKLKNGIEMVKMALCQHIGIPYSEHILVKDTVFSVPDPETLFTQPEEALPNRTEYQMLNDAVDSEVLQKRLAKGDFLPQLAVGLQAQYLDFADQQNTYGVAFATLSIPVSDWWGGNHKLKEHNIKIDIAKNNFNEKAELLKLQMAQSYNKLTESYLQILVAQTRVKQATEHVKVVTDNFEAGIVSTSDLLEARALVQESQDQYIDAQMQYKIATVKYLQETAR
jgi:multidrug efflux pump subunit AcrB/outer membrane protein TolC